MTPSLPTPSVPEADAPKPYDAPALTALGTVTTVTAGPDGGNLDQLFGGGGGFQDQTS